jgi:CheY-like chemotaxis protein
MSQLIYGYIGYVLSHNGYETAQAKDGLDALELLAQSRFDLVISDVRMPCMDGVTLARYIVSSQPITPIFLITVYHFDSCEEMSALNIPCLGSLFHLTSCCREFVRCWAKSVDTIFERILTRSRPLTAQPYVALLDKPGRQIRQSCQRDPEYPRTGACYILASNSAISPSRR